MRVLQSKGSNSFLVAPSQDGDTLQTCLAQRCAAKFILDFYIFRKIRCHWFIRFMAKLWPKPCFISRSWQNWPMFRFITSGTWYFFFQFFFGKSPFWHLERLFWCRVQIKALQRRYKQFIHHVTIVNIQNGDCHFFFKIFHTRSLMDQKLSDRFGIKLTNSSQIRS